MNDWLKENLVCPIDHSELTVSSGGLVCKENHVFPVIDGTPIMLVDNKLPTHQTHFEHTQDTVSRYRNKDTVKISNEKTTDIDPFVQKEIAATCGLRYRQLIDKLPYYPIPELEIDHIENGHFLDIGCNWGRWCIAAARKGFTVVGIDPYFDAIQAAKRVARTLKIEAEFLVADARYLPFRTSFFDVVFSYSVFQHFDKNDTKKSLVEIYRALKTGGFSKIQMLSIFGLRSQYNMLKRLYKKPTSFEVRYWKPRELKDTFASIIGPTTVSVDGFFSANPQESDISLLSLPHKLALNVSSFLKEFSSKFRSISILADSLYVTSTKK